MSKRVIIDPVTRIEGHLRIDVEVDGGKVVDAWSSGTMWRGIETILKGRDPREAWIFTQRICGVCTTVHGIASVRAVEDALNLEVPLNAQYIRNLLVIAHALHDHIVHFYQLSALDWVDITKAVQADPVAASRIAESLSDWPYNSAKEMAAVKTKLEAVIASGQLGIFTNGYWGHPAMELPPEVNLLAVAHYLQALDYQKKANQIVALLGAKTPNIQNLAVGGVSNAINLDSPSTLNMTRLYKVKDLFDDVNAFVQMVYFPDVCAIGGMYPGWLSHGAGVTNYLSVPDLPLDTAGTEFDLPGGTIMNGQPDSFQPISNFKDSYFRENVTESSAHAWYADSGQPLHPYQGETVAKYVERDDAGKYSWSKAPRFKGQVMQVGPLAQVLAGYVSGNQPIKHWADKCLETAGSVAKTKLTPAVLHSTIGRHAARAIRCAAISDIAIKHWKLLVDNIGKGDTAIFNPPTFPKGEIRGMGFHEAPRGVLSHWTVIRDGKIDNYQAVVPSTWNLGPRDEKDALGPTEAALLDNPVQQPELPLEALRTVHSFDPCLACAIHTIDVDGREVSRIRVI